MAILFADRMDGTMTRKPENFYIIALHSLANDLAVADPRWAPTVQLLRDAADEWQHWKEHGYSKQDAWDRTVDRDKKCQCGHPYYRHFDTYEEMYPCGCKYCECRTFEEPTGEPT